MEYPLAPSKSAERAPLGLGARVRSAKAAAPPAGDCCTCLYSVVADPTRAAQPTIGLCIHPSICLGGCRLLRERHDCGKDCGLGVSRGLPMRSMLGQIERRPQSAARSRIAGLSNASNRWSKRNVSTRAEPLAVRSPESRGPSGSPSAPGAPSPLGSVAGAPAFAGRGAPYRASRKRVKGCYRVFRKSLH